MKLNKFILNLKKISLKEWLIIILATEFLIISIQITNNRIQINKIKKQLDNCQLNK